jgi:hypothetical protein
LRSHGPGQPALASGFFANQCESRRIGGLLRSLPAQGWQFAAIATILVVVALSADRSAGVAVLSSSPTPAMENRVAPVLFMLTIVVDYL